MPYDSLCPQWLQWAKELRLIAQAGLEYSPAPFDCERFCDAGVKNS